MYVNGGSVIAIGVIFPILGGLAVWGKFVSRYQRRIKPEVDDWLCIPSLAFVVVTGILLIYGSTQKSIGYHSPATFGGSPQTRAYQVSRQQLLTKLQYVIDTMNPTATGLIRLSLLFFYRRIFVGRAFSITSWTMIGIVIAWMIALTVPQLAMCGSHLSVLWTNIVDAPKYCIDTLALLGWQGITAFMLDVTILCLPFPWIWRLHMPRSQKWAVSSVFLVGLFTVVAGACRMVAAVQILRYKWGIPQNVMGLQATNDAMGATSVFLFWQYIENGTGMVVCCLPALKGLRLPMFIRSKFAFLQSRPASSGPEYYHVEDKRSQDSWESHKGTRETTVANATDRGFRHV